MRLLRLILPYLYSALVLAGYVIAALYISWIWYAYTGMLILLAVSWWLMVQKKHISAEQLVIALSPAFFLISALLFFLLADWAFLQRITIVIAVTALFLFFRTLYFFNWYPSKYQPFSLRNISYYLNLFSIFFFASFLYAMEVFLNARLALSSFAIFAIVALIVWQWHFLRKMKWKAEKGYGIWFVVMLTEYFFAIGILPFMVYVKGFLFLLGFFVFFTLYQKAQIGTWNKKEIRALLAGSFAVLMAVLMTTRWF